jgi:hypothetical protein
MRLGQKLPETLLRSIEASKNEASKTYSLSPASTASGRRFSAGVTGQEYSGL